MSRRFVLALALLLALPLQGQEPTVVYLVRHAEKTGDSGDVPLSAAGVERAHLLARMLEDVPLAGVHSTDFERTRDTAAPTATAHGLEVELYDPRAPASLLERITAEGGGHLVVGHSNTTPALVELLGGDPGPPIDEATEYDRLYVVFVHGDVVGSSLLRFGTPSR